MPKKPFDPHSEPPQDNNDQNDASDQGKEVPEKPCHLKLVVSNPESTPIQEEDPFQADPDVGFTVEFYKEGICDALKACDHFHRLLCRVFLEIDDQEAHGEIPPSRSVVCNFPHILGKDFNEFEELNNYTERGEDLFGMILAQFQMKLLEQMLLFASDYDASTLVIHANNKAESDALEIYRSLATYEDKVPTVTGTKAHLVISTNDETFDKLIDLSDQLGQQFRQALWREQRNNPLIRWYIKADPLLRFFG